MTHTFDESLFAEGYLPVPGPLRAIPDDGRDQPVRSASLFDALLAPFRAIKSALTGSVRRRGYYPVDFEAVYFNHDSGAFKPIANAQYKIEYLDYSENPPDLIIEHNTTDSNGEFTEPCPTPEESNYDGDLFSESTHAEVEFNSSTDIGTFLIRQSDCNSPSTEQVIATNDELAHVLQTINYARTRTSTLFSTTRPLMDVRLEHGSTSCLDSTRSCYDVATDRLLLLSDTTSRGEPEDDHVWGQWGWYVQFHEYGHAFHWEGLEEPATNCGQEHDFGEATDLECAFIEGFANFFAPWIGGPWLEGGEGSDHDIEANPYRQIGDGVIIEGAVAGFWYDLVDDSNDPNGSSNQSTGSDDDAVDFPGSYLADLITTCKFGFKTKLDGIDEFIYCAEKALDAIAAAAPDSTEWREYSSFSESATEPSGWTKTKVRDLWLHNLYDR